MTDSNFCCLCASDEGVFLDIFTATDRQLGNRSFLKEFETCLSVKVKRDEALSTKICHRCAIELGQCNEFVDKYHRFNDATSKLDKAESKKSCCVCLSTSKNNYLFTLAKDFRSTIDPLQKIHECFKRQITREEAEARSICLLCRYNLDVLYDLRKLAKEVKSKLEKIAESTAILANLPKTKTFVVNRKTTVICKSTIEFRTHSGSDSDSDTMARKQSRSKKLANQKAPVELKLRNCEQCHTSIEGGIDMYRLHRTGLTVCKMCWITMDPFKPNNANKRKRKNQVETKNTRLCAVFLRDVLSPATSKTDGLPKVKKNQKREPIYIISDDDSDNEEEMNTEHSSDEEDATNLKQRLKRSLNHDGGNRDSERKKKLKSVKTEETTASSALRRSARYQSSDSDGAKAKKKRSDTSGVGDNVASLAKGSPKVNDVNTRDKLGKKKSNKKVDGKRKEAANSERAKSKSEDSASSGDGGVRRTLRKVRNKVPLILKPELPDSQGNEKNAKRAEPRRTARTESPAVSKNSSLRSLGKKQPSKIKLSPKRSKALMLVSFPFKLNNRYECKVCRTEYRNKIVGMKHELTHFKQVEIKIEKLNMDHNFQNNVENTPENESSQSTIEKPLQPELPTTTSPPESDDDRSKAPDHETAEEEIIQGSKTAESIQENDKPPDIDDAKEKDAVVSSNGHPPEESTLISNDAVTETVEDVALELATETSDGLKKVETSSAEADSVTETNVMDGDDTVIGSDETNIVDENKEEVAAEESDKTIDNIIEEKSETVKKSETEEKSETEKKSDEEVVSSSSKTTAGKDIEKDKDSGEEMESDTDIRIVDSGSSTEENEQAEKRTDDAVIANDCSKTEETKEKPIEAKKGSELSDECQDTLNNEPQADITTALASDNDLDARNKSNGTISKNEEDEDRTECEGSEPTEKIGEDEPPAIVTEILQEVMDLATAEVQKRIESGIASIPETLENISEEINKTAEGSPPVDEILASIDVAANEKTESCKSDLELNPSEISSNNQIDINAANL